MCLSCLAVALVPFFSGHGTVEQTIHYDQPIDALSMQILSEGDHAVRGLQNGKWTNWQSLTIENEQDPHLQESNMVLFDVPVSDIQIQGDATASDVHPIRISEAPVMYKIAATTSISRPRILTRSEWGADEKLLYTDATLPAGTGDAQEITNAPTTASLAPSKRDIDCKEAQTNYPDEFKAVNKVTTEDGKTLRWEHTYSKQVKLLVVHHTAIQVTGDKRSGAERMRALYQYHSVNRGWGDIGYHYVVDEQGQIYEGKEGGPLVVAGHAYCNNVGTVGIALLGNFEIEQPTQAQIQSLEWLLGDLAKSYSIDLTKNVKFHGKTYQPIIGHRDLLDTDCPGYYAYGLLDQIRTNVRNGDYTKALTLLPLRSPLPTTPVTPATPSAPPEEASEDSTGQVPSRIARLQRKIRTAVRLSSRVGGRASVLNTVRSTTSPTQSTRPVASRIGTRVPVITQSSSSRSSTNSQSPVTDNKSPLVRIRLVSRDSTLSSCADAPLATLTPLYRGIVTCETVNNMPALINTVSLEDYMLGLGEEPDTEPYEKQRAFAIAARTYAAYYLDSSNRKFPGMPYDGSDSPATFQKYVGKSFEAKNPNWLKAVTSTASEVLMKNNQLIKPPYFSSDTGTTRTPAEAGWKNFPFSDVFTAKNDPWCKGMPLNGHGVGMSGCGAKGQAKEGKSGEDILQYYYPTTVITVLKK